MLKDSPDPKSVRTEYTISAIEKKNKVLKK